MIAIAAACVVHLDVQSAAEHGDVENARLAVERGHAAQQIGGFQIQQVPFAQRRFNSAGDPSAITRPPYISAMRWQYSASSM